MKPTSLIVFSLLLLLLFPGCNRSSENQEENTTAETPLDSGSKMPEEMVVKIPKKNSSRYTDKVISSTTRSHLDLDQVEIFTCNISVVLHVNMNMDSLTTKDIDAFFRTFDQSCRDNVEFSEFSNETLFMLLENYPGEALRVLQEHGSDFDLKTIYEEIRSPLLDQIPINQINKAIINQKLKGPVIDSVKAALEVADSNS